MREKSVMRSITNPNGQMLASPTVGVADTGRGVPGYGHEFIEHFLNPDGIVVVEVNNQAKRLTVVETIFNKAIARHTRDAGLHPGVSGEAFRLRQPEILHDPQRLGVRSKGRVKETVRAPVL